MNLKLTGCLAAVVLVASLAVARAQVTIVGSYGGEGSPNPVTNAPPSTKVSSVLATNRGTGAAVETRTKGPPAASANYTNTIGMELVKVPGGFWAGKYEVTQNEYQTIMGSNPSAFPGDRHPVDNVSYNDAVAFCQKLTAHEKDKGELLDGFYYTLPTEDQWESLVGGAGLDSAVTSQTGARTGTADVGSLAANDLGLYDVRGNVMEFCLRDESKAYCVLRGGSWQDSIEINLRTTFRFYTKPDDHNNTFGFRCILVGPGGN